MFLKNLKLTNFRNFTKIDLDFSPTTLFLGRNAQGKSNILESIYFLATTKSSRAAEENELIKQGEAFCRVEGEVGEAGQNEDNFGETVKLEVVIQVKPEIPQLVEKRVRVNGVPRRVIDYIGNLIVVYFSPEDINLVTGSPSLRRSYLDLTLTQVDREYKKALAEYLEVLISRNKLLKRIREGLAKLSETDFWTEKLISLGRVVAEKRRRLFLTLNEKTKQLEGMGKLRFNYEESIISQERVREYQAKEIAAAVTLIGPHRDDFTFIFNGKNLAHFGSRGEQRTAILELKLAQLQFVKDTKNAVPVLLLDDIFSELDRQHQEYVISIIFGQQTVLSAVETEQIPQDFLKSIKVIKVEEGKFI